MRLQAETRELPVTLAPEELENRGADLAGAVRNADQDEEYLEGRKAAWREELKGLKEDLQVARTEASKLAEIVRTGRDKRDVTCTWKYALAEGWAFLTRDDTGERVQSRKLKDEERQLTIGEPPFAEPTPEELEEWLRSLPVNEEQALPEGHADEVEQEDRAVDLQDALDDDDLTWDEAIDHTNQEIGRDLTGEEQTRAYEDEIWGADADDDPAGDTEEEILSEEEAREFEEGPLPSNPGLAELAAMSDEQAEKLVRRSRAKR